MKQIRKRLTYANVMSSIAVFLILGGATAFAASKIGSDQLEANAVTTGKIKKEAVTTAKIKKEAVSTAKLKNGAVTTAKLASGLVVPTASKLALFAHVDQNGNVLAGSQGIAQANVTKAAKGFYCIQGLNPAPVGGLATVGYEGSGGNVTIQFDIGKGPVCPSGTQAFVDPRSGGVPEDAAFYLVLY